MSAQTTTPAQHPDGPGDDADLDLATGTDLDPTADVPPGVDPAEFATFLKKEDAKWGEVVKKGNIQLD